MIGLIPTRVLEWLLSALEALGIALRLRAHIEAELVVRSCRVGATEPVSTFDLCSAFHAWPSRGGVA